MCGAHELAPLRDALGDAPVLVVPGIRPAGAAVGDQARVASPRQAIADGRRLARGRPPDHRRAGSRRGRARHRRPRSRERRGQDLRPQRSGGRRGGGRGRRRLRRLRLLPALAARGVARGGRRACARRSRRISAASACSSIPTTTWSRRCCGRCRSTSCSSTRHPRAPPRSAPGSACRCGARSASPAAADLPGAADGADALLLDAKPSPAATRPGGNARAFDWSLLAGWSAPAPWVLAGGLTPGNVAEAVRITGAATVDVSSGVERAPGEKDPALIRAFIAAARQCPS